MKSSYSIFSHIRIPKDKLFLYLLFTLLSSLFSIVSIGMLAPFLSLIFNQENTTAPLQTNAIGGLKTYLQDIIQKDRLQGLLVICLAMVIATFFRNLFLYISNFISTPVRNDILSSFRLRLYNKVLRLPLSFYSEQRKGDMISRMNGDVFEVQASIIMGMEGLIKDPLTILGFLGYMIYLSPKLSLLLLLLLPITAFIIGRVSKRLKKQSNEFWDINGGVISHLEETLGGIKVIKVFNAEQSMMDKFLALNQKLFAVLNKMTIRRDLASPLTEVLGVIVLSIILYVGGRLALNDSRDLAGSDLISYIISFAMLLNPAKNLANSISNVRKGMGAVERIEAILQTPETIQNKPDAVELKSFNHNIEFRNVSFAYNEDTVILKNISFTIEKGKTVALVGSSGAGKSTVADLIPRLHDITGGQILIDGIDIRDYTMESLRKQMSVVTQEPILFNDTIASNIALGDIHASRESVTEAAKIANAHNFISAKEEGYDTNIGDRGVKLSGGERQRVTIARAVLQNPPILILDEATSSLDTESERLVQDAVNHLMKDRTSLVIAHRLSTIRSADEIIVLQRGEIIERGNHDSLMQRSSFYKTLVEMQEIK
ncbi:MAG: ABC transporter ATP-binding protein [Chitinophagaceae bacterium]|nr:ABC transporter ATP-binding protein [Chitinophagaceae bacterium]